MKYLLVANEFTPHRGGIARYLHCLCRELATRYHVRVLTNTRGRTMPESEEFEVKRTNFFSLHWYSKPSWWPLFFKLLWQLLTYRPDVIIVAEVLPVGTVVYLLTRIFRTPYVVTTYGLDIAVSLIQHNRHFYRARRVLQRAQTVTTISEYTHELLRRYNVPPQRIVYVYPGPNVTPAALPSEQIVANLRQRYQLDQRPILLTTGRLVARKNHETVLRALQKILSAIPELVYVIVGSGPELTRLQTLTATLRVTNAVRFVIDADDQELAAWYSLAKVFVLIPRAYPSGDVEGFGIVYLEAGSFGKPVIGSKTGGVPDAVTENKTGLLLDNPDDYAHVADMIIQLYTDAELYKQLAAGAITRYREFSWPDEVQKLIDRFDEKTR